MCRVLLDFSAPFSLFLSFVFFFRFAFSVFFHFCTHSFSINARYGISSFCVLMVSIRFVDLRVHWGWNSVQCTKCALSSERFLSFFRPFFLFCFIFSVPFWCVSLVSFCKYPTSRSQQCLIFWTIINVHRCLWQNKHHFYSLVLVNCVCAPRYECLFHIFVSNWKWKKIKKSWNLF